MSLSGIPKVCQDLVIGFLGRDNGVPIVSQSWRQSYERGFKLRLKEWEKRPDDDFFPLYLAESNDPEMSPRDSCHKVLEKVEGYIQDHEWLISDRFENSRFRPERESYESLSQMCRSIQEIKAQNLISFFELLAKYNGNIAQFLKSLDVELPPLEKKDEIQKWIRGHRKVLAQITDLPSDEIAETLVAKFPPEFALLRHLDSRLFGKVTIRAYNTGNEILLKKLSESPLLQEFDSPEGFHVPWLAAAGGGNIELLNDVIESPYFNRITDRSLGRVFCNAGERDSVEVMKVLLKSSRAHHISSDKLNETFLRTARLGKMGAFKAILDSERAIDLSVNDLDKAFIFIVQANDIRALNIFTQSPRFNDVPSRTLGIAFHHAYTSGYDRIVKALLRSARACDIDTMDLEICLILRNPDNSKDPWALIALIESPSFDRIHKTYKDIAMMSAFSNEQMKVVEALYSGGVQPSGTINSYIPSMIFWSGKLMTKIFFTQVVRRVEGLQMSTTAKTVGVAAAVGIAYWGL